MYNDTALLSPTNKRKVILLFWFFALKYSLILHFYRYLIHQPNGAEGETRTLTPFGTGT